MVDFSFLFNIMDAILSPIKFSGPKGPMFTILIISTIISVAVTLIQKYTVDQERISELRRLTMEYQKKMKEAREKNDQKEMRKLTRKFTSIQSEMMSMTFRPMLYYMLPLFLIFFWLRNTYPSSQVIVELPFVFPKPGADNAFGWLGWYILCSFVTSVSFRKILGIK
ncbi:MAG: EMC3/TMCO1 family protein [Candidatus Hydrothermarchaeota archaeon]